MNKKNDLTDFIIKGNNNSPNINFATNGKLKIQGRSVLENTVAFFQPVMEWIAKYIEAPADETVFELDMDYFNTSSSKFILSIFESLQKLYKSDNKVTIKWYYNDEDILEFGKDYSLLLEMPFDFIRKE